jgi:hypothetical protein
MTIGSIVNVYFIHATMEEAVKIRSMPQDVGDSWVLERPDGKIVRVILFEKMEEVYP